MSGSFRGRGSCRDTGIGPRQALLVARLDAFAEPGDRTEFSLFGAEQATQSVAQAGAEVLVGASGLKERVAAGMGNITPSGQRAEIGRESETQPGGIVATSPVGRSRPAHLQAAGQFDIFGSHARTGAADTPGPRAIAGRDKIRAFRGGFDGRAPDGAIGFPPPAATMASIRAHQGDLTTRSRFLMSGIGLASPARACAGGLRRRGERARGGGAADGQPVLCREGAPVPGQDRRDAGAAGDGAATIEARLHLEPLRGPVAARPDSALGGMQGWLLAARRVSVSPVTVWRAPARLGLTLKGSRSEPPGRTARAAWRTGLAPAIPAGDDILRSRL